MNWLSKFILSLCCAIAVALTPYYTQTAEAVSSQKSSSSSHKTTSSKKSKSASKKKTTSKKSAKKKSSKRHRSYRTASRSKSKKVKKSSSVALVSGEGVNSLAKRISAPSAMVMDASTGEAIYSRAPDTPRQPASTIKVLTGVISLDALNKNELVTVSRKAAMMPPSKVHLVQGRKYPANDLINAVLLASANDASVALAEKIGGSETSFARLMTAKARSFGATKTVCKTANGLTAPGQYTTAHDLALIFRNAMRNPEFAEKLAVTELKNTDGRIIRSHNRALWLVDGAEGGKTGYTVAARRTYVGKFKRDNHEIIVSLMGSESMWGDVKKLVEYGFARKRQAKGAVAQVHEAPASSPMVVQIGSRGRRLAAVPTL